MKSKSFNKLMLLTLYLPDDETLQLEFRVPARGRALYFQDFPKEYVLFLPSMTVIHHGKEVEFTSMHIEISPIGK